MTANAAIADMLSQLHERQGVGVQGRAVVWEDGGGESASYPKR